MGADQAVEVDHASSARVQLGRVSVDRIVTPQVPAGKHNAPASEPCNQPSQRVASGLIFTTYPLGRGLTMRTFEFNDGKSQKFWNIDLQGSAFTVTYGRLGTAGQTQTKKFANPGQAQAAHDKLVAEKLAKGYVETSAGAAAATPTGKVLENAIFANPDDLAPYAAYADWLTQQGDPRGEFIQVQLALEEPGRSAAERKQLQKREKELLKKHQRDWLGNLARFFMDQEGVPEYFSAENAFQCKFQRGWLDTLQINPLTVEISRALAKAPQTRLVRRLILQETAYEEEGDFDDDDDIPEETENPTLYPLQGSNYLGNVRVFQLGELYEDSQYGGPSCHTNGEGVMDLVKKMPLLEELYLMAHHVDTDRLFSLKTLTHLRILEVDHLHHYPLERLARNPALGQLTQLRFHPHGLDHDEAYIRLPGLRALIRSPHLRSLTQLRLCLSDMGDKGCEEIVNSGFLKRLKVLDLSHGCITDEGARLLAACPDLGHLELLNLNYNALTQKGINALKAVGIPVLTKDQFSEDEIEEGMYLYGGDPE
jgi:uncharacterized protein (TIGR02996 family)